MSDEQVITVNDSPPDLVTYYSDSVHTAQMLLEGAVSQAGGDYELLNRNLKGVNAYIKARGSIGELLEKAGAASGGQTVWDPFSAQDPLDTKLQVVQAKAEFTAVTSTESAAVALYQSGMTYRDICHHTGMGTKQLKQLIKKQGVQRKSKKSVEVYG